ncbi:hypothetical protein [Mycolicibacterium sp. CBMA 361]|uniref:hypothetical protein n=1 Tax=Mycolicibacterium sp. CBMA 361 TaxID=2606610 RepID=UPI0012DCE7B9|nr:hypothetical protein [Mycolicibacterium sp. CBMA 361]MUM35336.1 hypothetical protein [Mycolicibacterium sp. CBMA 361]
MSDERGIWLADVAQRENLATFVERILRLDEAAVVRLRARGDGVIVAWAATGFEVLAARVVMGRVAPTDLLPPENGFSHLDDVPARTALELSQRGVELAREHSGPQGPPPSLLDQDVLTVSAGDVEVGIPMRCVFALTAMGFVPEPVPEDEVIRVRVHPTWLRIDARFGSVYRRRSGPILLSP